MWVSGREGFLGADADDGASESEERSGVHDVRRISSSAASRAPVYESALRGAFESQRNGQEIHKDRKAFRGEKPRTPAVCARGGYAETHP